MITWLTYDLKVALLIVVFYAFYRLLVARETFHRLNRLVLLGSLVLSLLLPICHVTVVREVKTIQVPAIQQSNPKASAPDPSRGEGGLSDLGGGMMGGKSLLTTHLSGGVGGGLLTGVFLLGTVFCLARTYLSVRRVRQIVAKGELQEVPSFIAWRTPRMRLSVVDDDSIKPFSWMHTVVLSRKDYEQDLRDGQLGRSVILAHECGHVACYHSFDTLFVDVIAALQWFNPVVWLLREELRTVHEYEADARVISQGFNAYQYLNLLILKAAGDAGYSIANGISTSSALSKRVKMMLRHKSRKRSLAKWLYILPIVAVSLVATARVEYKSLTPSRPTPPAPPALPAPPAFSLTTYVPNHAAASGIVVNVPEKVKGANANGHGLAYYNNKLYVVDGNVVTEDELLKLRKEEVESVVVLEGKMATDQWGSRGANGVVLVTTKKGKPAERSLYEFSDAEFRAWLKEQKRAGESFGSVMQKLAKYGGIPRKFMKMADEEFYHSKDEEAPAESPVGAISSDDPIFNIVEQTPSFPGGTEKLMAFLRDNAQYPADAVENDVQGRVIVQFVVEKDGSISSPKVIKSVSPSVDEEALRVVNAMPKWQPGRQQGRVVRSRYYIPVVFRLS